MPPIVVPPIVPPPLAALTMKALPPASPVRVVLAPLPVIWPEPAVNWMPTLPAKPEALNLPVPVVTLALVIPESVRLPEVGRVRSAEARVMSSAPSMSTSVALAGTPVALALPAVIVEALTSSLPGAVWAKVRATAPPAPGLPSVPEPWPVVRAPPTDVRFATVRVPPLLEIEIAPPAPPSPPSPLPLPLAAPAAPPEAVIAAAVEVPPERLASVTAPPAPPVAPSPPLVLLPEPLPPRAEITPVFSVWPDPLTVRLMSPALAADRAAGVGGADAAVGGEGAGADRAVGGRKGHLAGTGRRRAARARRDHRCPERHVADRADRDVAAGGGDGAGRSGRERCGAGGAGGGAGEIRHEQVTACRARPSRSAGRRRSACRFSLPELVLRSWTPALRVRSERALKVRLLALPQMTSLLIVIVPVPR